MSCVYVLCVCVDNINEDGCVDDVVNERVGKDFELEVNQLVSAKEEYYDVRGTFK